MFLSRRVWLNFSLALVSVVSTKAGLAHEVDETGEFRLSHSVLESQTDKVFLFEEFGKSGDIHLCHPRYHKRIEVLDLGEDPLNQDVFPPQVPRVRETSTRLFE